MLDAVRDAVDHKRTEAHIATGFAFGIPMACIVVRDLGHRWLPVAHGEIFVSAIGDILVDAACVVYSLHMIEVRQTSDFADWLRSLKDKAAAKKIAQRIVRVQAGLLGDVKPVGEGVSELRVNFGPGYRLYFAQRGSTLVILLCGGDKGSQNRDIAKAKKLAKELE